ncbi:hypothetical protein VNO80_12344 [Phaseolus coccineus]|uniref:Uncharacterized protein n=1 Tax=Phaseolus coccineus TaxID=3886 RepID=A0AAN9R9B6_PHACN
MGNSLHVVLDNYIGSVPIPGDVRLGASSIVLSKDLTKKGDAVNETFSVIYAVDKELCVVCLTRHYVHQRSNAQKVSFEISDHVSMLTDGVFDMVITETNYIRIDPFMWPNQSTVLTKTNRSFDAWGGVVDTTVHWYGNGSRWGLLVVESKKKRREEEAEVATVAHYFVKSCGSTGTDIGLSMVAKCGVSNGKFDITVEGLEQHPVPALLYLFDEVKRTGIWKPTMCPHCDHKRRGKMFWQSDGEDTDSASIPAHRATRESARGLSNSGTFKGSGSGSIYENHYIHVENRYDKSYSTPDK